MVQAIEVINALYVACFFFGGGWLYVACFFFGGGWRNRSAVQISKSELRSDNRPCLCVHLKYPYWGIA